MNQPLMWAFALTFVLTGAPAPAVALAELRLAGIFGDHMVLQREQPVAIWGWTSGSQQVTVRFADQAVTSDVDDEGLWQLSLPRLEASNQGQDLVVSDGTQSLTIGDVVVGDVWHASGQSNMAMTVGAVANRLPQAKRDLEAANHNGIRFRRVNVNESPEPQRDLPGGAWNACSPETVAGFSAAAYYFARKLNSEVQVPIGIIDTSRGGTPIEPFIPREAFRSHPTLVRELELGDKEDLDGIWKLPGGVRARDANWLPGRLFHSRLSPICRFSVRGAIWYQGESNCGVGEDPRDYEHKMKALISGWRHAMQNDSLPFYFVQLPGSGARYAWPYLREQQRLSSAVPHSGMAVTIDLLDDDIHPPNKLDVGDRLARWALAKQYHRDIAYSGPLFEHAEFSAGQATVSFSHAESGLMVAMKQGLAAPREMSELKLQHFELANEAGQWQQAEAEIQDKRVVVRIGDGTTPVAVRYAYEINPQHCYLYNRAGLPASPFCSDPKMLEYQSDFPSN